MLDVHFTPGDGMGWALDEDLRQIRLSLRGTVREARPAGADVIHAPFWQNLSMVAPELLRRAFVISHADNPPYFYLKQPAFARGQTVVDLWVARSVEAFSQFQSLGLPVEHIPYTIDPGLFFPIEDRRAIRSEFGIPEDAYVIANFHRDTEGADLTTPKFQKAPELLVAILRRLKDAGQAFHVLLAGPRRHWIREQLAREEIPFTFVGRSDVSGDDFSVNILNRTALNKLYSASDVYVIPSRWEGGPQSAMEATACRCKVLSIPLGVARDILEPSSLFRSVGEAVAVLRDDMKRASLSATVQPQFDRWEKSHTTDAMSRALRVLYAELPGCSAFMKKAAQRRESFVSGPAAQVCHTLRRRLVGPKKVSEVGWNHAPGRLPALDVTLELVAAILDGIGVRRVGAGRAGIEFVGWPSLPATGVVLQWVVPGFPSEKILKQATVVASSVQDILNLRADGWCGAVVVCPLVAETRVIRDEPFLVGLGDHSQSLGVWEALASGRPVVYPEGSAYFEQVFHGGLSYRSEPESAMAEARESAVELRSLARVPTRNDARKFVEQLLIELGRDLK